MPSTLRPGYTSALAIPAPPKIENDPQGPAAPAALNTPVEYWDDSDKLAGGVYYLPPLNGDAYTSRVTASVGSGSARSWTWDYNGPDTPSAIRWYAGEDGQTSFEALGGTWEGDGFYYVPYYGGVTVLLSASATATEDELGLRAIGSATPVQPGQLVRLVGEGNRVERYLGEVDGWKVEVNTAQVYNSTGDFLGWVGDFAVLGEAGFDVLVQIINDPSDPGGTKSGPAYYAQDGTRPHPVPFPPRAIIRVTLD